MAEPNRLRAIDLPEPLASTPPSQVPATNPGITPDFIADLAEATQAPVKQPHPLVVAKPLPTNMPALPQASTTPAPKPEEKPSLADFLMVTVNVSTLEEARKLSTHTVDSLKRMRALAEKESFPTSTLDEINSFIKNKIIELEQGERRAKYAAHCEATEHMLENNSVITNTDLQTMDDLIKEAKLHTHDDEDRAVIAKLEALRSKLLHRAELAILDQIAKSYGFTLSLFSPLGEKRYVSPTLPLTDEKVRLLLAELAHAIPTPTGEKARKCHAQLVTWCEQQLASTNKPAPAAKPSKPPAPIKPESLPKLPVASGPSRGVQFVFYTFCALFPLIVDRCF